MALLLRQRRFSVVRDQSQNRGIEIRRTGRKDDWQNSLQRPKNFSRSFAIQQRFGSRSWQADHSSRSEELERRLLLLGIVFKRMFRGSSPRLQLLADVRRQRPAHPFERDRADLHRRSHSRTTPRTGLETGFQPRWNSYRILLCGKFKQV